MYGVFKLLQCSEWLLHVVSTPPDTHTHAHTHTHTHHLFPKCFGHSRCRLPEGAEKRMDTSKCSATFRCIHRLQYAALKTATCIKCTACTVCTVYSVYSVQRVQCTVCTVYSVYSIQRVQCTACTVYNVQYTCVLFLVPISRLVADCAVVRLWTLSDCHCDVTTVCCCIDRNVCTRNCVSYF